MLFTFEPPVRTPQKGKAPTSKASKVSLDCSRPCPGLVPPFRIGEPTRVLVGGAPILFEKDDRLRVVLVSSLYTLGQVLQSPARPSSLCDHSPQSCSAMRKSPISRKKSPKARCVGWVLHCSSVEAGFPESTLNVGEAGCFTTPGSGKLSMPEPLQPRFSAQGDSSKPSVFQASMQKSLSELKSSTNCSCRGSPQACIMSVAATVAAVSLTYFVAPPGKHLAILSLSALARLAESVFQGLLYQVFEIIETSCPMGAVGQIR